MDARPGNQPEQIVAGARLWECPGCGKRYRIPAGKKAPALCPACRHARDAASAEPSPFEQLSAAVQAVEESQPLPSQGDKPHAADRPAAPTEPSPFEQFFAAVESGENERAVEPRPSDPLVPVVENSSETPAPHVPETPRRRKTGQWQVFAVAGIATILLAGWGLYGILTQSPGGNPGTAEVWKQAKAEVAERLLAPKTAEFPKPGEIRRVRDSEIPRWSVKSVVDASNARGVPVRHQWLMEIAFDPQSREWEAAWIEIDGERVYASPETVQEDRANELRESATGKERAVQHERPERTTSDPHVPERAPPERRAPPAAVAASEPESEFEREARRERGKWREIATFEGLKKHETRPFQIGSGGWRYRWTCDGDATLRLYDAAGKPVGDEIEAFAGDQGTQFVPGGPGRYTLRITTDARWMIVVEE